MQNKATTHNILHTHLTCSALRNQRAVQARYVLFPDAGRLVQELTPLISVFLVLSACFSVKNGVKTSN